MIVRTKDVFYVRVNENTLVVRPNTTGVTQDGKVFFFPDVTGTAAIGFPKESCLNLPALFSISRTIEDKEVSLRDVLRVVENSSLDKTTRDRLLFDLQSL